MRPAIRRVQYASSLYVDSFEKLIATDFVRPAAPVLVLAGQIGKATRKTESFLNHCSRLWDHVIYVPSTYDSIARPVASNIHILDNEVAELGDVAFVGSRYCSEEDMDFIDSAFEHYRSSTKRLISITSRSVVDKSVLTPYNLWICGHSPGGGVYETRNGVLLVYNSRGSVYCKNHFDGMNGWQREAVIDIPDNYSNGSTLGSRIDRKREVLS